jgi:hypothetical protein
VPIEQLPAPHTYLVHQGSKQEGGMDVAAWMENWWYLQGGRNVLGKGRGGVVTLGLTIVTCLL